MNIEFRKPTINDAKEISTWKYDGIYSKALLAIALVKKRF